MTTSSAAVSWKCLAIVLALLAPLVVFFDTARSIVAIWNQSDTFAHGYIILPISLWLIWQRRDVLRQMPAQPYWPGLLALAACGFGWLLAELADVQVVRQYMFILMIPLSAIVVLGWQIAWAMAFPLLFLILAVPFGEIFIAPLINFTADFTIAALRLTGIPVLREGNHFTLPSGSWSVVEACSGLRYLISSFTLGCLYAYLSYRSFKRRLFFILFSIIVPIIANGLRAYMIVMLGHLSGMTLAVGVDHLIYGWLFFGLVMFFMFWIGSFWRETDSALPATPTTALAAGSAPGSAPLSAILLACLSVLFSISLWPGFSAYLNRSGVNPTPVQIHQFKSAWQEAPNASDWKPEFTPAHVEFARSYQKNGQPLGMQLNYYRNQTRNAGLINAANQLVDSKDHNWRLTSSIVRAEALGELRLRVNESRIQGNRNSLLVWQLYWIDGKFIASAYEGKLRLAKQKLLLQGDDGVSLIFYAPYDENPDEARLLLRDFLNAHLSTLALTFDSSKKP